MYGTHWSPTTTFQSTHPVRGGTVGLAILNDSIIISIHPPRAGWDDGSVYSPFADDVISIHPPRAGWDPRRTGCCELRRISIHPPRAGWDLSRPSPSLIQRISIHPPRAGWDQRRPCWRNPDPISIHPPRAGWDVKVYKIIPFYCTALYGNDKRNGKRHSEIAENGCVFPKHRYARQKHSANRHGNLCSLPLRTFK